MATEIKLTSFALLDRGTRPTKKVELRNIPAPANMDWPREGLITLYGTIEAAEEATRQRALAEKNKQDYYEVTLLMRTDPPARERLDLRSLEKKPRRFINLDTLDMASKHTLATEYYRSFLASRRELPANAENAEVPMAGFEFALRRPEFLSFLRRYDAFSQCEAIACRLDAGNRIVKVAALFSDAHISKIKSWGPYGDLSIKLPARIRAEDKAARAQSA
jgi:hypothetical protein